MKVYIVTEPKSSRGIYETWAECKAKVNGMPGARYQSVENREKAEAMLAGGVVLSPGIHAFTDGNAAGGVGVAILDMGPDAYRVLHEIATSVSAVFVGNGVPGLESEQQVGDALGRLHNILAELAALYHALGLVEPGSALTVVHDLEGIEAWMSGRWKRKDPIVAAVIEVCHRMIDDRGLEASYRHQRGHQSSWAGRDDYATWNKRADELATRGGAASR